MRQRWYGAGGFSYKSTWTSQELCPLSILVVNFYFAKKYNSGQKETKIGNGERNGRKRAFSLPLGHHSR